MAEERLQKLLAEAGLCSRRQAEELIRAGRVEVNGRPVLEMGAKADPEKDRVLLDGERVRPSGKTDYYMAYKPAKVIASMKDDRGRPDLREFAGSLPRRVFPVGRLDFDSEGLILLTNDGELANLLLHPSSKVPRTYEVKVKGRPIPRRMQKLRQGMLLDDGPTKPAKARILKSTEAGNTWIEIRLTEGRNRQVRRMCQRIGHPVMKLRRTGLGPLRLGPLKPWTIRPLTKDERDSLEELRQKLVRKRERRKDRQ